MAAAATIVASRTLRVHMLFSFKGLPRVQVTPLGRSDEPVDSFTGVGLDRPCSSDSPYLVLELELPMLPEVLAVVLAAQPISVYFASVGFSLAQSALRLALPVDEVLSFFREPDDVPLVSVEVLVEEPELL